MTSPVSSCPSPRMVKLGTREYEFPSPQLQQLKDANHLLGNRDALLEELEDKGYLYIRGLHDREEVLNARLKVLAHIRESGQDKLRHNVPWQEGVLNHRCGLGCIPFMEGKNPVSHSDEVLKVIEGDRPKAFFRLLLEEEPISFDYKWLRGIHPEGYTGAHVDNVYMGRGTQRLYTMWTPIGDIPPEMGTLAVCEGSHRLPSFSHFQSTYGNLDVEEANLDGSGWFTSDPEEITIKFGGVWKTSDFQAGDVMIFSMRLVHMSTTNLTEKVRISCDTRWLAVSDNADPRYMGDFKKPNGKFGVYGSDSGHSERQKVNMTDLKKTWGLE